MIKLATIFFLVMPVYSSYAEVEWSNPPVLCSEELLPRGFTCPDFSSVKDPYTEFPSTLTAEEIKDWTTNKTTDLRLCRNLEIMKREKNKPGSYSEATIKGAWMIIDGGKNAKAKLEAIQKASQQNGIPPQILIGALKQESGFSSIGVAPDGGNYSCGLAQMNIQEWCESVSLLSAERKKELGWPSISCDSSVLPTDVVKPLYEFALKRIAGKKPSYAMTAEDYDGLSAEQFGMETAKFTAANSFLHHCQNATLGIEFKAKTLRNLYDHFVPKSLKESEIYSDGESFQRPCTTPYPVKAYPLHTGWLLAVAMYNAGPVQAKLVGHYYQVKNNNFPEMNPLHLIEALHWGGKWIPGTDSVSFEDQNGKAYSQRWFKSCIVQRHVARVIQHVTVPTESIARPLDKDGCKMTIPDYRKISSGIKESL